MDWADIGTAMAAQRVRMGWADGEIAMEAHRGQTDSAAIVTAMEQVAGQMVLVALGAIKNCLKHFIAVDCLWRWLKSEN